MAYTLNPDDKFGVKDTLAEGHPEKKILGVEFDDEFNKISTAIETIEGDVQNILLTGFPEPPESDPADPKVYARTYYDVDPGDDVPATGDWVEAPTFAEFSVLKDQVNNLDPDGDNSIQWDEIKEKPDVFPPEAHIHQVEDIEGLEDALANAGEVEEAPKDGVQYARQDAAWTPVSANGTVISDTPPADPSSGDMWFNSTPNEGALYIYDGSVWFSSLSVDADIEGGPANPSVQKVATGTLATGEMVVLNADGTVSIVEETVTSGGDKTAEMGEKVEFYDVRSYYLTSAYDANSGKIVIAHAGPASDFGAAIVGEISGDTIVFGTQVIFNSNACSYTSVCFDQSSGKAVISFRDSYDKNQGKAVAGEVSGDTILFGSPVVFESDVIGTARMSCTYDPSVGKVVIAYMQDFNLRTVVGSIAGGTLSFSQPSTFVLGANGPNLICSAYDPISESTVIAYIDDRIGNGRTGAVVAGKVAGNSITLGAHAVFDAGNSLYPSVAYDHESKKMVIAYRAVDLGKGRLVVCTVSGGNIDCGAPVDFADDVASGDLMVSSDPVAGKVVIVYPTGSDKGGTIIAGKVSSDSVTFDAALQFENINTQCPTLCFDPLSEKFGLFYSVYPDMKSYGRVYSPGDEFVDVSTNLTQDNFIGVSKGDYSDGDTATVLVNGAIADRTGLTTAKHHYVQADGTVDMDGTGVFVGTALSSSELIVEGSNHG